MQVSSWPAEVQTVVLFWCGIAVVSLAHLKLLGAGLGNLGFVFAAVVLSCKHARTICERLEKLWYKIIVYTISMMGYYCSNIYHTCLEVPGSLTCVGRSDSFLMVAVYMATNYGNVIQPVSVIVCCPLVVVSVWCCICGASGHSVFEERVLTNLGLHIPRNSYTIQIIHSADWLIHSVSLEKYIVCA